MRKLLICGVLGGLLFTAIGSPMAVASKKQKRVVREDYVGWALPGFWGGYSCAADLEGFNHGCVRFERLIGDQWVDIAIEDSAGGHVSASFVEQNGTNEVIVHRFCTSTSKPIRIDPATTEMSVVIWQGACTNFSQLAVSTMGTVTAIFRNQL